MQDIDSESASCFGCPPSRTPADRTGWVALDPNDVRLVIMIRRGTGQNGHFVTSLLLAASQIADVHLDPAQLRQITVGDVQNLHANAAFLTFRRFTCIHTRPPSPPIGISIRWE